MTEDDVKNVEAVTELKDDVLGYHSFAPVSNVENDDLEQKIKEEKKSERLEKLRSYYEKLGQTRDFMQQELSKVLAGEADSEEIDAKLYEFTHSSTLIAEEINRYDEEHGHPGLCGTHPSGRRGSAGPVPAGFLCRGSGSDLESLRQRGGLLSGGPQRSGKSHGILYGTAEPFWCNRDHEAGERHALHSARRGWGTVFVHPQLWQNGICC